LAISSSIQKAVLLEIFKASKFLKDLGKVVPKNLQKEIWGAVSG